MNARIFGQFRSSLLRCLSNLRFLDRFYAEFTASSEEVAQAFAKTDMERQKAMLNASMYQLMNLYEKPDLEARKHVQELGALHGNHGLRIPVHLYDLWLDSLILAASASDPEFNQDLERIWREVMMYGIDLMKASADNALAGGAAAKLHADGQAPAVDKDALKAVVQQLQQLSKEAAHHSNVEKDMEAMAFQFGQYRAYLHAGELVSGLLKKKSSALDSSRR